MGHSWYCLCIVYSFRVIVGNRTVAPAAVPVRLFPRKARLHNSLLFILSDAEIRTRANSLETPVAAQYERSDEVNRFAFNDSEVP